LTPAKVCRTACQPAYVPDVRDDYTMPESTLSPQSGTMNWLQVWRCLHMNEKGRKYCGKTKTLRGIQKIKIKTEK
jgi:hypothetical protein